MANLHRRSTLARQRPAARYRTWNPKNTYLEICRRKFLLQLVGTFRQKLGRLVVFIFTGVYLHALYTRLLENRVISGYSVVEGSLEHGSPMIITSLSKERERARSEGSESAWRSLDIGESPFEGQAERFFNFSLEKNRRTVTPFGRI